MGNKEEKRMEEWKREGQKMELKRK